MRHEKETLKRKTLKGDNKRNTFNGDSNTETRKGDNKRRNLKETLQGYTKQRH